MRPFVRPPDPDLARLLDLWPSLSPEVRESLLRLAEATRHHLDEESEASRP